MYAVIFEKQLLEGVLLSRYKRFFADVQYQGEKITIHVPNTGSLKTVLATQGESQKCLFSLHNDPSKKLKGTLEAVRTPSGVWVGINTSNPNRLVQDAARVGIATGQVLLPHWKQYTFYKPEAKINKETRLDGVFLKYEADLKNEKISKHYIEIKNTTYLAEIDNKKHAQFPDAETERGQKHLLELMKLMQEGHTCELIFTVQRNDAEVFSPCKAIDPVYADLLQKAIKQGLRVTPLVVQISATEVTLTSQVLPVVLN